MNNVEGAVAEHYTDQGLIGRILAGLEASGLDVHRIEPEDLAPVDEFHLGGRQATIHALSKLSLNKGSHLLDIGCGIGGAVRYIAAETGCRVTGIDLTPEYISVARTLTNLTTLGDRVRYDVGSALAMPYQPKTFDAAISFHVAMNIHDRAALYGETARVMKPGATLCIYDVMKISDGAVTYPMPWAGSAETSHLTTPDETEAVLVEAGFEVVEVEDRAEIAKQFFKERAAAAAASPEEGPPPLGLHLILGADAPVKLTNIRNAVEAGILSPVQIIAVRKSG